MCIGRPDTSAIGIHVPGERDVKIYLLLFPSLFVFMVSFSIHRFAFRLSGYRDVCVMREKPPTVALDFRLWLEHVLLRLLMALPFYGGIGDIQI